MYENELVIGWEFNIFLVQQFPVLRSRSLQNHVVEVFFTEAFPDADMGAEPFKVAINKYP
jgi:hypothetical protein